MNRLRNCACKSADGAEAQNDEMNEGMEAKGANVLSDMEWI